MSCLCLSTQALQLRHQDCWSHVLIVTACGAIRSTFRIFKTRETRSTWSCLRRSFWFNLQWIWWKPDFGEFVLEFNPACCDPCLQEFANSRSLISGYTTSFRILFRSTSKRLLLDQHSNRQVSTRWANLLHIVPIALQALCICGYMCVYLL